MNREVGYGDGFNHRCIIGRKKLHDSRLSNTITMSGSFAMNRPGTWK